MVSILILWLPILLSAVAVFILSSIIHMAIPGWHRKDFKQLPEEDKVMDALRPFNIPPGSYVMPYASKNEDYKSEAFRKKLEKGPAGFITIVKNQMNMLPALIKWFGYSLIVGIFTAYIATRTLTPATEFAKVLQITSAVAFMGYSLALIQNSIWFRKSWMATLRSVIDGILYGLATGAIFAWLWPGM